MGRFLTFLPQSGIADFYGQLYYIGKNPGTQFSRHNSKKSYKFFITELFPSEWRCYAGFLYTIFRCGVMHQLSPKLSGLAWEDNDMLVFSNPGSVTPHLNVKRYGELVYQGFEKFKEESEINAYPEMMTNICNSVIDIHDGLGDQKELNDQLREVNHIFPPYGPCR